MCKYRKKLLLSYGEEVKRIFEKIAARSDFSFEAEAVLEGTNRSRVMDTFAVRLATPVKQASASILNNKGEGGQFIHEAEDFVVFLPVVYKSKEKIDMAASLRVALCYLLKIDEVFEPLASTRT